ASVEGCKYIRLRTRLQDLQDFSGLTSYHMMLRTAVIGAGSLGRQHARIHATLAAEGSSEFVSVCDLNEETARSVSSESSSEKKTGWTTDWRTLVGQIDAASIAVPTEVHCEIACGLLESGIHVLVEKPIS